MTKSKIIASAIAALTLTSAVIGTSAPAQAGFKHHFHPGLGILAIGALATAATVAASHEERDFDCRYVKRHNRWGAPYMVKICDEDDD